MSAPALPGSISPPAVAADAAIVGIEDIRQAAEQLGGGAIQTPGPPPPAPGGAPVPLKCELLQRTGSFKLRGAFVHVARMPAAVRHGGVVAASAGNHAQGVALAPAYFGIAAAGYMPPGA